MKNKVINLIVVILSAFIFLFFFLFTKGINRLIDELKSLNVYWIIGAITCVVLFWIFETLTLYVITKSLWSAKKIFLKTIKVQMVGQFFGAITPFASGSHPAQLYSMIENEVPAGIAGSILMIKFILHQVIILIYLIIALLFKFNYFNNKIQYFLYLCVFGFIVHGAIVLVAILFSVNKTVTNNILTFIVKILLKVKIIKSEECTTEKINLELESFHKNAMLITQHKKMCIYASIFTSLQWFVYFMVPYFIYRSFGFNYADMWTMIVAQIFLTNFMTLIPLPGAEGGAEGGFYLIYRLFFKANTTITAILIWRVLTYYLSILVSSIFTVILPDLAKEK